MEENKTLDLGCNLFHFKINNSKKSYFKYLVSFNPQPELKQDTFKIWESAYKEINKIYSKIYVLKRKNIFQRHFFLFT